MANQANVAVITQMSFLHGLAEQQAAFVRAGARVVTGTGGSFRVSGRSIGGLAATLSKTATSSTPTDIANFEASVTTDHKVIHHTVNNKMLQTEKGYEDAGTELANKVLVSMDKDWFDYCEGLPSLAHPRVGTGPFQVGASKKFADTSLAYLQTEGGAGTQDNLLTTAFSETSLDAAIQLLNKYKDDRGVPLHLGLRPAGLALTVGPKNRKTAEEVVQSMLSGDDNAKNTLGPRIGSVVVWNWTTDEDDWMLLDRFNSPVGMFIAAAPTVRIAPQTNGLFTDIIAEYESAPFVLPYECGLVFSNVA